MAGDILRFVFEEGSVVVGGFDSGRGTFCLFEKEEGVVFFLA